MPTAEQRQIAALGWKEIAAAAGGAPFGTQAIRRAFLTLRVLQAGGNTGLGLSEVARATALMKPTVHRVLQALIAEGVIEQRPKTQRYIIAPQAQIPTQSSARLPLVRAALSHLDDASDDIGDTLFLTLRSGNDTICVARRVGHHPIQVLSLSVGVRRPIGVSASGIALLSTMKKKEALKILQSNARYLRKDGSSIEEALVSVSLAKELGYALRERGLVTGTRAISIPFGRESGPMPATITVAAIARRMSAGRIPDLVGRLKLCASRIEASRRTKKGAE